MRLTVIGAGAMGHGVAHVGALGGYDVTLTDARPETLEVARERIASNLEGGVRRGKLSAEQSEAALARVALERDVDAATRGADLVIEAIVEDLAVKRALFTRLDALVAPDAVLATNTSSLSVARIADATSHPERVLGMHFFNPVHIMKLVELVVHPGTSPAALDLAREAAHRMGKDPIVVRDSPGFASSRLGVAVGLEAMRMVEEEVASPADIDKAMRLGYGHPMGPLELSDLVGLDVRLAIADYLHQELGDVRFAAPAILRRKVEAGELGKKTGKGFYEWPRNESS
ncbi:MAG: 3-hydroxyacyl-CoA dehydrogenase family protein [Gemmatimonadota bacterium]|nr:MAG: 3-hydroxyacyl-CoA dehydrogenase family protein [Gemmatimonadota bacterium]